ncbi:MAG TPA: bifunctional YncE family protein/alkaline phosphatase family protein [Solirubrobacteraceae bacterium]|nr:bifunctional YncE family protein/alkaline phosphatase family protein [Solirubrobacteraceae bacterium]
MAVGNLPTGGALTPDGRFYWTVSAGAGINDVRIVSVRATRVVQTLALPGASGGVAIDPRGGKAYVSGLASSVNKGTARPDLPGAKGDVIHVFSYAKRSGQARETAQISVAPPAGTPAPQDFPLPQTKPLGYPEHPAVSPNGRTLLVPLGLAQSAAVVDLPTRRVRFVATGNYPYGAAITADGRRGLVSNETPGTVSVIDLRRARKLRDISVGGHLAHPEAIAIGPGARAYVTIANRDQVAVLDTRRLRVQATLSVRSQAGVGTSPNAVAVTRDGRRVLVSEGGADALSVFGPGRGRGHRLTLLGRIPTAHYPTDVASAGRTLVWLSGKGLGSGANPNGPNPFNSSTLDQASTQTQFLPRITSGSVGVATLPAAKRLRALTRQANAQLAPANRANPTADTPLRSDGPIKHVFFIVRENRTYDQVLGDVPQGDGARSLTLFGAQTTPNLHALVQRFGVIDHAYANSEASQQGHQWTSAGTISDFTEKNWNQISSIFGNYGARGRPLEPGLLAASFPPRGYLFDQALRQKISFFNYGESYAGDIPLPYPQVPILAHTFDRDRTPQDAAAVQAKVEHSDFGPGLNDGCFPNAFYIANDILTGKKVFDSSVPAGAPAGAESRVDCFRSHLGAQLAAGSVPAFNYLTLTNDHTVGLTPKGYTPRAMVADNDLGTGQIVDTISHSPIWSSSAIFIVEDDSQDGADHVDAHRIPVAVISPYSRPGAVVHTRYDMLSVIRSFELMLGMNPLSLNDALATPMYDAFQSTPANAAPYTAVPETQDLLATNPSTGSGARAATRQDFTHLDAVAQRTLDAQLWKSVHGARSQPPPPGPHATPGHDAGGG